jgi:hypothetical protein
VIWSAGLRLSAPKLLVAPEPEKTFALSTLHIDQCNLYQYPPVKARI